MEQCERSGHPLPEGRVIQLMMSLCKGLHAMHSASHSMAHRDVKVQAFSLCVMTFHSNFESQPANLLLTDSRDELVLMDLGSAAPASISVTSRSGKAQCVWSNLL